MSDALAAQREARRRKITQNAQARMNRLLGQPEAPGRPGADVDSSTSTSSSVSSSQQANEDQPLSLQQESPYNLRQRANRSGSPAITSNPVLSDPPSISSPIREVPLATPITKPTTDHGLQDARSVSPQESDPQNVQTSSHGSNQATQDFDAKSLELLRILACFMTSFTSRSVLRFGFGVFMVQSIFLPFLAMEILFIYTIEVYMKSLPLVQSKGTLMSAALMLCGIKPDLMDVYQKIMSHFTIVVSDFGLYLFSFIIWNAIIT